MADPSRAQTLPGRDPRNREHVLTAHKIILEQSSSFGVLEGSLPELARAGVKLPPATRTHKKAPKDSLSIGLHVLLEQGLLYPDNVILKCAECRVPIQFRPNLAHSIARPMCIFCVAEQALREGW